MNTKIIAAIAAVLIILAAVIGYIAGASFSGSSTTSPSPTPFVTASPTPAATATIEPTTAPTATSSPKPTASPTPTASPEPATTLTVFVASSMVNVVANMTAAFEKEYNCKIVVNSGSSSTLETQIAAGSPCDVFLSADKKWTTALSSANLVDGSFINNSFTTNELIVILAQGNPKNITSLADLVQPGVKIVIAEPSVPVGSYTNTTLTTIDNTWGNPNDPAAYITNGSYVNYYTNFQKNVINSLQSDEQVVGAVNLNVGVADAGIVYVSDEAYANLVGEKVSFMTIPSAVNTVGIYGICIPKQTTNPTVAQDFYNFWLSTQGQTLLTEFGFGS